MLLAVAAMAQPGTGGQMSLEQIEQMGNPLSTQHDEVLYVHALRQLTSPQSGLSEDELMRPRLLLELALKNQMGDVAADFAFVAADGTQRTLHAEAGAPLNVVYFNDPDCDACKRVKSRLDTDTLMRAMVSEGRLKVIAIYTLDDEDAWRAAHYPDYMLNGWDQAGAVEGDELYNLPVMPLFYVLDQEHRVLLKNEPSLNRVRQFLSVMSQ